MSFSSVVNYENTVSLNEAVFKNGGMIFLWSNQGHAREFTPCRTFLNNPQASCAYVHFLTFPLFILPVSSILKFSKTNKSHNISYVGSGQ